MSMPSRAVTSFLPFPAVPPTATKEEIRVNALSGCYLISTELKGVILEWGDIRVNALSGCYLISTVKAAPPKAKPEKKGVNALSGCYLISTVPLQKTRFYAASRACFCRYLSEYSDNSCFSCMLTFWTYLMRFTYP